MAFRRRRHDAGHSALRVPSARMSAPAQPPKRVAPMHQTRSLLRRAAVAALLVVPFAGVAPAHADFVLGPPPGSGGSRAVVVALGDGRVLQAGGRPGGNTGPVTDTAAIYDPATRAWTTAAPMGNARYGAAAALLTDGKVLVCGGYDLQSIGTGYNCERYDPARDVWLATRSMPLPAVDASAVRLADGRVLVCGGSGNLNAQTRGAQVYDPLTNRWTQVGSSVFTHPF